MEKTKKIIRVWAYKVAPDNPTMSQRFAALNIAVNTVELITKMTEGKPSISNFTGVIEEYDTVICEISEEMTSTLKHAFPFISILNP